MVSIGAMSYLVFPSDTAWRINLSDMDEEFRSAWLFLPGIIGCILMEGHCGLLIDLTTRMYVLIQPPINLMHTLCAFSPAVVK
jgi:hypothetical protein